MNIFFLRKCIKVLGFCNLYFANSYLPRIVQINQQDLEKCNYYVVACKLVNFGCELADFQEHTAYNETT